MSDTGQTRSRTPLLLLAIVATLIGGFFGARHLMNGNGDDRDEPDVDLARVAELRNLGLAWIENLEYDKAADAFRELTELVPDERLPWQNLAIAELLKAEPDVAKSTDPEFPSILDEADKAIAAFAERYGDTAESHILRARHYLRQLPTASFETASAGMVESYRKALAIEDSQAFLHYQLFDAVKQSHDESLEQEGFAALKRAWELDRNNLQLMRDLLPLQAEAEDPGIVQSLEATRHLVEPYADYVKKFAREDIVGLVDRALVAAREGNWKAARSVSRGIGNVLVRAVGSMNDNETVKPHLLEFLHFQFSPELEKKLESFRKEFPPAIPVSFSLASDELAIQPGVLAAATGDLNLDNKPDIVVVRAEGIEVLHQKEAAWETLTSLAQVGLTGVHVVDLDRDAVKQEHCWEADPDLIAFGPAGVFIIENRLDDASATRSLKIREQTNGLTDLKNVLAVLPVDFDHDGDLDLIVSAEDGMSTWLNLENWTFANHSQHSQLPPASAKIHTMVAVDWDRDVAIDVLCLGEGTAGRLSNILHGRLRWEEFPDEASYLKKATTMSVLDADANFSWDVLSASPEGVSVSTTMNPDAGIVKFTGRVSPVEEAASGATTWDYDNDGFLDIVAWDGAELLAIRGGHQAQFESVEGALKLPSDVKKCLPIDIDMDGDLDLLVLCEDSLELVLNEGGNKNESMRLPIRAEDDDDPQSANQRVNMHCVGSLIEVVAGTSYQALPVTGQWTHIGLGQQKRPDSIRVLWTNGIPEHIIQPEPDKVVCLQQKLKGSCPYIYTWDGQQYSFFTDCLWAAPIGLQLADGVQAPCREWEYLKIDGDRLVETDGEYRLLITEELWEVGYVDSMRLLEVWHPKDVAVYSNEKVGPPSISEFKVHTVRSPRKPLSVTNHKGRDLLPELRERDDNFAKPFDRKIKQGLTEPHYMEFDLGDLSGAKEVTLFLTGWIRPTDTSLNIAISQRPDLESTQPPSIFVPDEKGEWQQVRPFIGFPGGKTKTISVDLSGVFLTDDFRVRLATSMEIYWDEAFFTVDEAPVELKIHELPLQAASLSYRGFSKRTPHPEFGPERYDASSISKEPHWPPVLGRFTSYGNVLNLVEKTDNRMVALGAGDSIEVRFQASKEKLPEGWTRDFILHNVGWDKDSDLNTVFGQTVGPLPFAGMSGYPDLGGAEKAKPFADQTRTQSRVKFWRLMFDEDRYRVR